MNFMSPLPDRDDDLLDVVLEEVGLPEERQTIATNPSYLPVELSDSPLSLSPERFYMATLNALRIQAKRKQLAAILKDCPPEFGLLIKNGEAVTGCSGCNQMFKALDKTWVRLTNFRQIRRRLIVEELVSHGICPGCFAELYPDFEYSDS